MDNFEFGALISNRRSVCKQCRLSSSQLSYSRTGSGPPWLRTLRWRAQSQGATVKVDDKNRSCSLSFCLSRLRFLIFFCVPRLYEWNIRAPFIVASQTGSTEFTFCFVSKSGDKVNHIILLTKRERKKKKKEITSVCVGFFLQPRKALNFYRAYYSAWRFCVSHDKNPHRHEDTSATMAPYFFSFSCVPLLVSFRLCIRSVLSISLLLLLAAAAAAFACGV